MKAPKVLVGISIFALSLIITLTVNISTILTPLDIHSAQAQLAEQKTSIEQAAEILEQEFRKNQNIIRCHYRDNNVIRVTSCPRGFLYNNLISEEDYKLIIDELLNSLEEDWFSNTTNYSDLSYRVRAYGRANFFFRIAQYTDIREYEAGKRRALSDSKAILVRLEEEATKDINSIFSVQTEVTQPPQGCRRTGFGISCNFGGGRTTRTIRIENPLNSAPDIQRSVKVFELLQQVNVLEGRRSASGIIENVSTNSPLAEALKIAEYNRTLAIDLQLARNYFTSFNLIGQTFGDDSLSDTDLARLHNFFQNSPQDRLQTIHDIQAVATEEDATLVFYSLISQSTLNHEHFFDSRYSYKNVTLPADQLYIWVVDPKSGKISFIDQSYKLQEIKRIFKTASLQDRKCRILDSCRPISGVGMDEGVRSLRGALQVTNRGEASNNQQELSEEQKVQQNEQLTSLYELLIRPIEDFLPQNPREKVIILPEGSLNFLPFAALKDTKRQEYLIQQHTIVTAPNIRTLLLTQRNQNRNSTDEKTALIVANPLPLSENLESLPAAEREAQAIEEFLGKRKINVTLLKNEKAGFESVTEKMMDANIIHFATHGSVNVENSDPDLMDRILSYFQRKIRMGETPELLLNDDWPELYEIWQENVLFSNLDNSFASGSLALSESSLSAFKVFDMNLQNTDLVVLSACNTGIGPLVPGGVIGLPYSFSAAGVPSIVMSLWAVPDGPTADLMTGFYNYWLNNIGTDKAQALQLAMQDMIKEYPDDPRYWAAFTLVGSSS